MSIVNKVNFWARHIIRTLLALMMIGGGLSYFIKGPEGPMQNVTNPEFVEFYTALLDAGYLILTVKVLELVCGIALLTNQFTALALLVLGPIVYNISMTHFILMPPNEYAVGVIIIVFWVYLLFAHKKYYKPLLKRW